MKTTNSISSAVRAANRWRDSYNPLRGLTIQRAASLLEAGERGDYADLQWLYRTIEKRDSTVRGGKRSLISAISEMDWNIRTTPEDKLPSGMTAQHAEAQAQTLRVAYDRIANLRQAIDFLALADFRGFSHLEKIYDDNGDVILLDPIEQWYWCRDGLLGDWIFDASAQNNKNTGENIDLENFVVREVDDPINEIALIAFVRKSLSQKDWDGFVEGFGIPPLFIEMPSNVPQGKEKEYMTAAESVISGAKGVLPNGAGVKTVDAAVRGVSPFKQHLDYQDEQIVLAITSGLLTMLAESGSGTLAGGAHSETFQRIAKALGNLISETLQQQFDAQILAEKYPDQPVLAYFQLAVEEETDSSAFVDDAVKLASAGYQVDAAQIREKTGYDITLKPQLVQPAIMPPRNRRVANRDIAAEQERFIREATAKLDGVAFDGFDALKTRLQAILDGPEDQLEDALKKFQGDLPSMLDGEDKATIAAWEAILSTALMEGLQK